MWLINWKLHFLKWKTCSFVLKFIPQNAENRILELWNFKIFQARTCPDPLPPPRKRGPTAPCWYSRLLYSNLLATSTFIETPDCLWEQGFNNHFCLMLLQARRGACNPNLQVIITHASHLCSQHSFGLPLRMYGKHRTHFDHARLDLLSLVFWSCVFWLSVMWNLRKAQWWRKSDRCCPRSVTFGYYQ